VTGVPPSGPLKVDEIDKIASEACTRSGAFALLVSVLLLLLCVFWQNLKTDQALAGYIVCRQTLAMWLDELQKDKSWQKYIESHPDAEEKALADVIHAQVPITFPTASPKTETSKPEELPHSANPKPRRPNSSHLPPAAPTVLSITAVGMVDQYEMPNIVAAWQGLNNSERLTKSRGSSNYFALSIVKWANRRGNLIYSNVLSGMCRATELEIPRKGLESEQYVPRINDEALMNCISLRDLRELA
jgi:hypothetical protein